MRKLTDHEKQIVDAVEKSTKWLLFSLVFLIAGLAYITFIPEGEEVEELALNMEDDKIENGIDIVSNLVVADGYKLVKQNCTGCHSGKLITDNRATRDGWEEIIRWMQETQNLWDLGKNEDAILAYLAKNYAPIDKGRRQPLKNIDWYVLNQSE